MRGFFGGFVAAIVIALVGGFLLVKSGFIPANADAKPGMLELWMARTSLRATLVRESPKGPNPVPLTDANLIQGINLYGQHCVTCHGTAAGDASASPAAKGMYPKPPQLASDGVEDDPQGYTYWKLLHGIRLSGMPSWRGTLTDPQMWTLALFLRHMDKLPPSAETAWKNVSQQQ